MKVVHLAHYYWPHVGGIEKHLALVADELAKKGVTTTVITKQFSPELPTTQSHNNVEILRIPVSESLGMLHKLSVWSAMWSARAKLIHADIIHVHDVFWWLLPIYPLLKLLNRKVYITFHGYEGSEVPTATQIFWHKLAEVLTDGNLCIGGFHQKYYTVTPTLTSFGAAEHQKQTAGSVKKNTALFIGRLEEDNGFFAYLQAIKLLKDEGKKWHLDVYGEGSQLKRAKEYVQKHNLSVTFFGFVPEADTKLGKYSVAFVSRYLAIIEALLAQVPVVAQYNNAIKKDYLGLSPFSKWIQVVSTPEEIASELQKKLTASQAGYAWAKKQTWEHMAETYVHLWKEKTDE